MRRVRELSVRLNLLGMRLRYAGTRITCGRKVSEKKMALKLFNKHFICVFCDERKRAGDEYIKRGDIGICKECCKIVGENARMQPFPGKRDTAFLLTPFEYREPLRSVILDYKFKGCHAYAPLLSEMMKDYLMSFDIWQDVDMIIPVPLHEKRLKERGYNQAELLANYVSEYTKAPLNTAALTRVRNTRRQSGLTGTDRITNVAGAFKCGEDMRGKTIVLLDDIYTTGNTIQSCAAPLKEAGAYRICAVTLAKHTFEKNPASMY